MKSSTFKLISVIITIIMALVTMPTFVSATDTLADAIILQKSGEKIVYVKDMSNVDYKYALTNEDNESGLVYMACMKDSKGENVALIEGEETYKYMFLQNESETYKIELDSIKVITEDEIKDIEKLTQKIAVESSQSDSNISKEDGTTVTTTTGKIVIKDEGTYQYQMLEIVDKNNSTDKLDETAVELYSQLSKLSEATKMYDKLLAEVTIRDDYNKLLEDAKWEDAKNKEIPQPKDSQEGEKYVVLIQEVKDGKTVRTDVQFMTCAREDDSGVEETNTTQTKTIEKKTKLPVTGENLVLYIIFGVVILAIIILAVRIKKDEKNEE